MANPVIRSLIIRVRKNGTGQLPPDDKTHCGLRSVELSLGGRVYPQNELILGLFGSESVAPADLLANAVEVNEKVRYSSSNLTATSEPGEDNRGLGDNSIWFKWTAPRTETFLVSFKGSSFVARPAVYTGDNIATLSLVVANNWDYGTILNATEGVNYKICVRGSNNSERGDVELVIHKSVNSGSISAFASCPSNTSCSFDPINPFIESNGDERKINTPCGTSWLTINGEFNSFSGLPVSGAYRQLVCVYPVPLEIDAVVVNNYHYFGQLWSVWSGVAEIEVFGSLDAITQAEAEQHVNPVSGEFLLSGGVINIPLHDAVNAAQDFIVPAFVYDTANVNSSINFNCKMGADSATSKAKIGGAFLLGMEMIGDEAPKSSMLCGFEIAARFFGGDEFAFAGFLSALEVSAHISATVSKSSKIKGNVCVGCLMSGRKIPQAAMRAAMQISSNIRSDPSPEGGIRMSILSGSKMAVSGSHLCELPEFKKYGFF